MASPVRSPMITCPTPLPVKDRILLGHGSGGKISADLLRDLFLPVFRSPVLGRLDDQAVLEIGAERLAFTTDSFVVKPLFFRAGDTKVVEKGSGDGVFINTTGIGCVRPGIHLSAANARPGDLVLLSGTLGDHGITILSERQDIGFDAPIESDSSALHTLVRDMLAASPAIRCLRDPTRGGLSSALNEIAALARIGVELNEPAIPVREVVRGACELLGFDPLYVANEGKLVAIVPPEAAGAVLAAMRHHPLGRESAIIGTVTDKHPAIVTMKTAFGTTRIVDMLPGDQLPRIC